VHVKKIIKELDNSERRIAQEIWSLFQRAYAIEAQLIPTEDFPPLKRTVSSIQNSDANFKGLLEGDVCAAVAEFKSEGGTLFIDSFVVDPKAFRQGYGSQLLRSLLEDTDAARAVVDTAVKNEPAIRLYEKFGFEEVGRSRTKGGIEVVQLGTVCSEDAGH
jgi:ribosomal protein S18 acetylase RimI-like enzyme